MVRQLVALHEASETYRLPHEGLVAIGRRLDNQIICRDISVSGKHCVIVCKKKNPPQYEVVDCSSNGTFVNDRKLSKGQRLLIGDGDVVSLMKPLPPISGGEGGATPSMPIRVQFRLDARPGDSQPEETPEDVEPAASECGLSLAPATPGDWNQMHRLRSGDSTLARGVSAMTTAEGFAQDLLVQEQQSKAKITGELLLARRRLDEERVRVEGLSKELRKVRAMLEDEQSRRTAAQEVRDRLLADSAQLRTERRQLQDLREKHAALQDRHDTVEVDLTTQVQRAASLEAAKERSRNELERAQANTTQMTQQLEELQGRLQKAQSQVERFDQQQAEARQAAEAAQQEAERLQRELGNQRGAREQLEDQQSLLNAEVERLEQSARAAQDLQAAATAHHEDLEARAARSRSEADSARVGAREAQAKHEAELDKTERLRGAADRAADGLRAFTDHWARGLSEVCGPSDVEPGSGGFGYPRAAAVRAEGGGYGAVEIAGDSVDGGAMVEEDLAAIVAGGSPCSQDTATQHSPTAAQDDLGVRCDEVAATPLGGVAAPPPVLWSLEVLPGGFGPTRTCGGSTAIDGAPDSELPEEDEVRFVDEGRPPPSPRSVPAKRRRLQDTEACGTDDELDLVT